MQPAHLIFYLLAQQAIKSSQKDNPEASDDECTLLFKEFIGSDECQKLFLEYLKRKLSKTGKSSNGQ